MNDATRKEKSLKLMDRGFDHLETYEYKKAVKIGKKLIELRHTSGFEIQALAYAGLGKKKKAIRILEEGVQKGPGVWLLWQLLGNYYSDVENYAEALAAYDQALQCSNPDAKSLKFNRALVLNRQGKDEEALLQLQKNRGSDAINFRMRSMEALLLQALGETTRALRIAKNVRRKLNEIEQGYIWENDDDFALVYSQLGEVFWKSENKKELALECARQALELKRNELSALTLLRNITNAYSPKAKYFRLMIEGNWPEPLETEKGKLLPAGFLTTYDVVADDREEAFAILLEFEPEEVRTSLKINETEVLEERPQDPKGVYRRTGYGFFPKKSTKN